MKAIRINKMDAVWYIFFICSFLLPPVLGVAHYILTSFILVMTITRSGLRVRKEYSDCLIWFVLFTGYVSISKMWANSSTNSQKVIIIALFETIIVFYCILEYVKDKELKLNINTVVSKKNINQLDDLGNFLNKYKINSWRVFQFMPLRETAEKNREQFEISDAEFESKKGVFQKFENIGKVDYRQEKDMEDKYVLLVANGDIVKTENGKDVKKGNALYQNLMDFME